uniref:Sulfatase-modifying factor enzyme-like domain-containing protein n=1 Tax=Callorhinchus milii TaxID=7868 RepID=A0A4W3INJ0_CALMI
MRHYRLLSFLLCAWSWVRETSQDQRVVELAGGTFRMGTDASDARDGEAPARGVTVKPFAIDVHPVTNAEFREFVRSQKYKTEAESFGWSFVFEDFVSAELRKKVTQKIESAPWWLPVEKTFWRQVSVSVMMSESLISSWYPGCGSVTPLSTVK